MNALHIITPMNRLEHFFRLQLMLEDQGINTWHLLFHPDELKDLDYDTDTIRSGWLQIHAVDVKLGNCPGLHLVNQFISKGGFLAEDYYQILCDDDWLEPEYVKKLKGHDTCPLIIVGMKRGEPSDFIGIHPTWNLIADPNSLRYGCMGVEQGVFKGWLLNQLATEGIALDAPNEDFLFKAAKMFPTEYLPDVNVWFNYLEPGRWKKPEPVPIP